MNDAACGTRYINGMRAGFERSHSLLSPIRRPSHAWQTPSPLMSNPSTPPPPSTRSPLPCERPPHRSCTFANQFFQYSHCTSMLRRTPSSPLSFTALPAENLRAPLHWMRVPSRCSRAQDGVQPCPRPLQTHMWSAGLPGLDIRDTSCLTTYGRSMQCKIRRAQYTEPRTTQLLKKEGPSSHQAKEKDTRTILTPLRKCLTCTYGRDRIIVLPLKSADLVYVDAS